VEYHTRRAFNITQTIVEVVIPANNSDPILAAFLLTKKKNTNLETDLVDEPSESFRTLFLLAEPKLRSSLPKFMIPNVFIPLNRIPLTPSGKANRRTLREWASGVTRNDLESYTTITAPKQSPVTATEITLHRIWACLLFLDPESIGIVRINLQEHEKSFELESTSMWESLSLSLINGSRKKLHCSINFTPLNT